MRKINWPRWLPDLQPYVCLVALALLAALLLFPSPAPTTRLGLTPLPAPRSDFDVVSQYGWASWYGKPFHGRKTASGVAYDMGGYSVAHKTMKLGTFVVIQNTRNGRWCVAIVNDRGPYIEGRDWDVSAAVAKRLGMVWHGVVPVKVRTIDEY